MTLPPPPPLWNFSENSSVLEGECVPKTAVCTLRSATYDWEYNKGFDVIIQEYHGISATDKINGHVEFDMHVHMSKYPLEGGTGSSGESQHLTLQKLPHWQTFFQESTHFVTLSFWNGVHWHRFIYVEDVFVKPHKIRFLPQDDNVWQPKDRRSRKMHPPRALFQTIFSPKRRLPALHG